MPSVSAHGCSRGAVEMRVLGDCAVQRAGQASWCSLVSLRGLRAGGDASERRYAVGAAGVPLGGAAGVRRLRVRKAG